LTTSMAWPALAAFGSIATLVVLTHPGKVAGAFFVSAVVLGISKALIRWRGSKDAFTTYRPVNFLWALAPSLGVAAFSSAITPSSWLLLATCGLSTVVADTVASDVGG